jgi:hypothetical protein
MMVVSEMIAAKNEMAKIISAAFAIVATRSAAIALRSAAAALRLAAVAASRASSAARKELSKPVIGHSKGACDRFRGRYADHVIHAHLPEVPDYS